MISQLDIIYKKYGVFTRKWVYLDAREEVEEEAKNFFNFFKKSTCNSFKLCYNNDKETK